MSLNKEQPRVAIVGCGIAGIATAIALKTRLNFHNFVIFEKGSDVGGAWRDNIYPGCSCDIPPHWYSLSTECNPNWSEMYASQPELLAYWKSLVVKYSVYSHVLLYTQVVRAVWDSLSSRYVITLRDTQTGEERIEIAEVLVSASGGLTVPNLPQDIPGIETFDGPWFHSARWRTDVDLRRKRVGVVGNAASAVQLIPKISEDPSIEVINFCRSSNWFVEKGDNPEYSHRWQWIFAHVPGIMTMYRAWIYLRHDVNYLIFQNAHKKLRKLTHKRLIKQIERKAPKEYLDKLIPDYPPGCRRILVDPDYLSSLHRPNVTPTWDRIAQVLPSGVLTISGRIIPLDILIYATGFKALELQFELIGQYGLSLSQYYGSKGGPEAYLGTAIPGFPNFFTILGPNTATGHASAIFTEECQINYILQLLGPLLAGKVSSIVVKQQANERYNESLQRKLKNTVFTECRSHYHTGGKANGKIMAAWPGPVGSFWWITRYVNWSDYELRGAAIWIKERQQARLLTWLLLILAAFVLAIFSKTSHW